MEFPTIDQLAKEVAEKALDEITYEGKTIREWVEIIAKQQPCKNYIDKEALIEELKLGFLINESQEAKNDPCIIDKMIDWAIRTVKRQPSVTPKTSCEACREQVLKHLEKEDWADTVKCVMNMPFMKGEENVLDQIRAEIAELEEGISSYHNDRPLVFKNEVLQIIDKYKDRK